MYDFKSDLESALQLDKDDELSHFRHRFHIPKHSDGSDSIYLCGNSLGLQPKLTQEYISQELNLAKNPYRKKKKRSPKTYISQKTISRNIYLAKMYWLCSMKSTFLGGK